MTKAAKKMDKTPAAIIIAPANKDTPFKYIALPCLDSPKNINKFAIIKICFLIFLANSHNQTAKEPQP